MADSFLLQKAEQAVASVLATPAASVSATVFQGKSDDDKTIPCVIVGATSASEDDPPFSANKWITVEVTCKYTALPELAEDTVDLSNTLTATIQDALRDDAFATSLSSAVSGFHCYCVMYDGESRETDDSNWFEPYFMRLYCCAKDSN